MVSKILYIMVAISILPPSGVFLRKGQAHLHGSMGISDLRQEMQISEVLVRPEGPYSLDALLMSDLGGKVRLE